MNLDRRKFLVLAGALAGGCTVARAQGGVDGWYPITSDDGAPVANLRLPVELFTEVDELRGLIRVGATAPEVTIVEFYDYNCPYCRKAAADLSALIMADRGIQLGLVNNPILSPASRQAAQVELAVLKTRGSQAAHALHEALYRMRGVVNGDRALAAAVALGSDRDSIVQNMQAADVGAALEHQLRLAASLGFSATPSFLIAGAGVLGYPGPRALARIVEAVRRCDEIVCR
jgi:protein-disulfide isomerase